MAKTNWPPMPCPSCDCEVFFLGNVDGIATYVVDDREWQSERDARCAATRAMLAERLERVLHRTLGVSAEMEDLESEPESAAESVGPVYTTNDLWLEIIDFQPTNSTAHLVIHAPPVTPAPAYDLYFRTNLNIDYALPFGSQWRRILRAEPGQTNLVVTNLPSAQGFFTIGPTNNAIRPGFTNEFLIPNDDNQFVSNALATIGFSINFFGVTHTNLYVNNNGNVTFDFPKREYDPNTPLVAGTNKIIAPYWADVDTRGSGSDVVWYGTNSVDGHWAFGVNWVNVGYYQYRTDKLLTCQLMMIDRSDIAAGDFDLEFNYDGVQWEYGDASIGSAPRVGFSDGSSAYELPGSGVLGAFLDPNYATGLIYGSLNSPVSGRYRFFFRDGTPLQPLP